MNSILKNVLAVLAGIAVGASFNMGIITISGSIIPPPDGADVNNMEGLKATMHLFEPKHFLMPFLAHALGTLVGALIAALIAASHKLRLALVIGVVFLAGGIQMVMALPSPLWFSITYIVGAYIPMAYFGAKLGMRKKSL